MQLVRTHARTTHALLPPRPQATPGYPWTAQQPPTGALGGGGGAVSLDLLDGHLPWTAQQPQPGAPGSSGGAVPPPGSKKLGRAAAPPSAGAGGAPLVGGGGGIGGDIGGGGGVMHYASAPQPYPPYFSQWPAPPALQLPPAYARGLLPSGGGGGMPMSPAANIALYQQHAWVSGGRGRCGQAGWRLHAHGACARSSTRLAQRPRTNHRALES